MILGLSVGVFFVICALVVCAFISAIALFCSQSFRKFLKVYSGAITLVFALLAAVYTLIEYDNAKQKSRKNHTLQYIARIQSGQLAASRRWFDVFLLENVKKGSPLLDKNASPDDNKREAKRLEDLSIKNKKNRGHVIEIFTFYSDVSTCVNLEICDSVTACQYFGDDIGNFYYIYANFVERWKEIAFQKRFEAIATFVTNCS